MNSGTIIVTIVFLVIVILPFILTGYSRKNKKKSMFSKVNEMAQDNSFTITNHEICGDLIIGIDEISNHLFFYKNRDGLEHAAMINLRDFQSCKILNSNRTERFKKKNYYIVDKLELCFHPKNANEPSVLLEIYNDEHDSLTLTGELQLIEKWEKMLNEKFKNLRSAQFTPQPKASEPIRFLKEDLKKRLVKV